MAENIDQLTWATILKGEKEKEYFKTIIHTIKQQRNRGKTIYPAQSDIFNALKYTAYSDTKVVIIGQDPYHGPNQAHGLSFSVKPGVEPPPSLKNIFTELNRDLHIPIPNQGCLEKWAKQGVLLLNSVLTVEAGKPQSHAQMGWQIFTDKIIKILNDHPKGIVYLLWGASARSKSGLIDQRKHKVLQAPHPSPLSAYRGYFGCRHFSKANALLKQMGREEINWRLDA